MDKVSIIVPVYKVEKYLERCVTALTGQTHRNIEIILVDDGSPDNSGALCDRLAEGDSRIVAIHQENQGVSAARNHGLDVATGDWICFCDGDDWYEPEYVETFLSCAAQEKADYLFCDYQIVSDGQKPIASHSTAGFVCGDDVRKVIACAPMSSCTHMIRRSLFDVSGVCYPVGCRQYEELPVIPALAKFASRVGVIHEPLYNYYQRADGSSASNAGRNVESSFRISLEGLRNVLGEGYEQELEYHAIYALHYGEILALCKQHADRNTILKQIKAYEQQYPAFLQNRYLDGLGTAKRLFLYAQKFRAVFALRIFAKLHSIFVH